MYSGSAGVTETQYQAVGLGQTIDTASTTLVAIALGGNERAALFRAVAFSDQDETRTAEGLGRFVPGEGWELTAVGSGCSLSLTNLATVAFAVDGTAGTSNWIGRLEIIFTQNYETP